MPHGSFASRLQRAHFDPGRGTLVPVLEPAPAEGTHTIRARAVEGWRTSTAATCTITVSPQIPRSPTSGNFGLVVSRPERNGWIGNDAPKGAHAPSGRDRATEGCQWSLAREGFIASSATASYKTGLFPQVVMTPANHFGAKEVHVIRADCSSRQFVTEQALRSSF